MSLILTVFQISGYAAKLLYRIRRYTISVSTETSQIPAAGGWVLLNGETNIPIGRELYVFSNGRIIHSFHCYGQTFSESVYLHPSVQTGEVRYLIFISDNTEGK